MNFQSTPVEIFLLDTIFYSQNSLWLNRRESYKKHTCIIQLSSSLDILFSLSTEYLGP